VTFNPRVLERQRQWSVVGHRCDDIVWEMAAIDQRRLAALAPARADPGPRVDLSQQPDDPVVVTRGLGERQKLPLHLFGRRVTEITMLDPNLVGAEHLGQLAGLVVAQFVTLGHQHYRPVGANVLDQDPLAEGSRRRVLVVERLLEPQIECLGKGPLRFDRRHRRTGKHCKSFLDRHLLRPASEDAEHSHQCQSAEPHSSTSVPSSSRRASSSTSPATARS